MRTPRIGLSRATFAVLVLGLALSLWQQSAIPDEVFVSGDGGLKTLLTRQFAQGQWHVDLRLSAEPWVHELWQEGFHPFGPPFAYEREGRWWIAFPVPFMVVTAPFYAAFGFRGLTIVPLLGLWLLWLSVAVLLRRFDVSEVASALSLGGLIFCSYITPYGAMYWEHTLALGLSFLGLALLLSPSSEARRTTSYWLGGFCLGAAIWFRPESASFAAAACIGLALLRPGRRAFMSACAGVAVPAVLFACLNLWLYGSPLGIHAIQQVDVSAEYVSIMPADVIARHFVGELFRFCPVVGVLIAATLAGFSWPALRADRNQAALWLIVVGFSIGTVLLVPNDGGTQIGARYFMHALPPLFLLLGLTWDRAGALAIPGARVLRSAIAIGLLVGVPLNAVRGSQAIFRDYRYRALPSLQALRETPEKVVVVEHQWIAQDLESLFDDKIFFRVHDPAAFERLAQALIERGHSRFTLVRYGEIQDGVIVAGNLRLRLTSLGRFGDYVLVQCEIDRDRAFGGDDAQRNRRGSPSLQISPMARWNAYSPGMPMKRSRVTSS